MPERLSKFRVGLTRDFLDESGRMAFKDIGLSLFERAPQVEWEFMAEQTSVIQPGQIVDYDGVISLTPRYTRDSFVGVERLTAIGRFGVGYDNVDVQACTEADVLLFITTGSVNRPVAEAILTLMLSLSHHLLHKDRLVRTGLWQDRVHWMGSELRDKVIGTIGLGGIARELCRLLAPFGTNQILSYDPFVSQSVADSLGVGLTSLDGVLEASDFVSVNCPLNEQTRNLIGERELALMKPTSYLINTARGGIVNETALFEILRQRRIAGAALDVFEQEPVPRDHSLLKLDNVILSPHAIAWTDELFLANGIMDCEGMLRLSRGQVPDHVVNREVLKKESFLKKLARYSPEN